MLHDTFFICTTNEFYHWIFTIVLHGFCQPDYFFNAVKQLSLPVVFQHPPDPFNGIILAVIRRIINRADPDFMLYCKINQSFHKLASATVILRPVVGIDRYCMGVEPGFDAWPKIFKCIYHEVRGSVAFGKIKIILVNRREKNTKGF